MTEARASFLPHYIKASSPLGLRRLMLLNNTRFGSYFKYFNIGFVNDGKSKYWIAWYFNDINLITDEALEPAKAGE